MTVVFIGTPQVSPDDETDAASTNLNKICHARRQTRSTFIRTDTPEEKAEDAKAELSDTETFATCMRQLMQRVSREIALDLPSALNDQT